MIILSHKGLKEVDITPFSHSISQIHLFWKYFYQKMYNFHILTLIEKNHRKPTQKHLKSTIFLLTSSSIFRII